MESSPSEFIYTIISEPQKRLTHGLFNIVSCDIMIVQKHILMTDFIIISALNDVSNGAQV